MKRLPPNQTLRDDFPVLHHGEIPAFHKAAWDFMVSGLVRRALRLSHHEFMEIPASEVTVDFHCVTGWSKFDLRFRGVLFKDLAAMAGPLDAARFVSVVAEGGYTTNMPIEAAMRDGVILAYEYDGKPLTPAHGFPLRLVVPQLYAYKSAKWVRGIEFLERDRPGFWETRGYSNSADPWKEERFS